MHGLTYFDKAKIYSGDKTPSYEKLGMLEEGDLEKYKGKIGLKHRGDIDLKSITPEELDKILVESGLLYAKPARKHKTTPLKSAKKEYEVQEFRRLVAEYHHEMEKLQGMDDGEREAYLEGKGKLKEVLRSEEVKEYPIIVKAGTAGTLETLLKEAEKLMLGVQRVHIADYGVGPITEGDMQHAIQSGAVIFGFDVPCQTAVERGALSDGCCIKMHKLIHRFVEDVRNFVHDAKREIEVEEEHAHHNHRHHASETCNKHVNVVGSATVTHVTVEADP